MSDSAIIKECLVHYDSRHIQVRKDFYDLCAYDETLFNKKVNKKGKIIRDEPNQECMAKIVRLLETLTDDARKEWYTKAINARKQGLHIPNEPEEFPIKLTYGAICILLYNTYGESTVRNSVAVLIQWGYIKWHQATINSIPRYILNTKLLQDALYRQAQERVLNSTATQESKNEAVENTPPAVEFNSQGVENTGLAVENNTNNNYYNKPFNKSLEKEESASLRERLTTTPSFAKDELAKAVDYLNANGYQVTFEGEIPGNDLLFWMKTPEGKEHFETPDNLLVRARSLQETPSEENIVESTSEQNVEVYRQTLPVSPLSDEKQPTDESNSNTLRIERETAIRASSSPVVDAQKDVVVHEESGSTATSYSPSNAAPTKEVEASTEQQGTGKGKGSGKGSGKGGSKKKQQIDLEKVEPVPPPSRPSDEIPWNAKKLLLWADYFRGYTLPLSNHPNSRHYKAEHAAIALIQRGAEERQFLAVMRYMRGVNLQLEQDLEFRDEWWPDNQTADVWNAEAHFDEMLKKARQSLKNRKQNTQARAGVASTMMTPQTRQPANVLKAPEGWTAKRAAGGEE